MDLKQDFAWFSELVEAVAGLYGQTLSQATTMLWWNALRPYAVADVQAAFNRYATMPDEGSRFMPRPAQIIELICGSTADAAEVAWARVVKAARTVGAYADVVMPDPVAHRVIADMGGWVKLCATKEDELPFRAKDFKTLYTAYARRGGSIEFPAVLTGIIGTHNLPRVGRELANIRFVAEGKGEEEQCMRVMRSGMGGSEWAALADQRHQTVSQLLSHEPTEESRE